MKMRLFDNIKDKIQNTPAESLSISPILRTAVCLVGVFFLLNCYAGNYTDDQIADAIFKAEGENATYLYGIRSVKYQDEEEARQICLNTIRNNRRRYKDYGHKEFSTYLEFLAARYCPVGAKNDPKGLNKNWLKNVKYFLMKGGLYEKVYKFLD